MGTAWLTALSLQSQGLGTAGALSQCHHQGPLSISPWKPGTRESTRQNLFSCTVPNIKILGTVQCPSIGQLLGGYREGERSKKCHSVTRTKGQNRANGVFCELGAGGDVLPHCV